MLRGGCAGLTRTRPRSTTLPNAGAASSSEFAAHCQQGVELGFDGKTLLHPVQINKCNELFARRTQSAAPQVDPSTYSTEWAYQVDTWGCYPAQ